MNRPAQVPSEDTFMPDVTLTTLRALKQKGEKITMLTCYDATFADACSKAGVEVLLIGDSLGMVLQGHDSTLPGAWPIPSTTLPASSAAMPAR